MQSRQYFKTDGFWCTCMKVSTPLNKKKNRVFSTEYKVHEEALDSIQALPILQKLDAELEKAINALANAKAPGNDATPWSYQTR